MRFQDIDFSKACLRLRYSLRKLPFLLSQGFLSFSHFVVAQTMLVHIELGFCHALQVLNRSPAAISLPLAGSKFRLDINDALCAVCIPYSTAFLGRMCSLSLDDSTDRILTILFAKSAHSDVLLEICVNKGKVFTIPGKNKVEINRSTMDDPQEVVDTVAHELRHAYQHQRAGLQETWQDMLYKINFEKGDLIPYDAEIIITYHEKKEITIPFSERSLRKMNYVEAGDRLQELGFTEIYEKPIRDLVTGWVKKDGTVEKVTIGGLNPFKKNSIFPFDVEIVIEYHTFKKK